MYSALLKPFHLKTLRLNNRIVLAPMTLGLAEQHVPGKAMADFFCRRIENGINLLISEATFISPAAVYELNNKPYFFGEKALIGWREVVDRVHQAGGQIILQPFHAGGVREQGDGPIPELPGLAPSAVIHPFARHGIRSKAMTLKQIDTTIAEFAMNAKLAKALGFDGIEIHGAHGFLIDQFFWPYTNRRTDRYGGKTLQERARFAYDVIQAVRQTVGITYPISFRFSQWKLGDYTATLFTTPQELAAFLQPLTEAGVDIFHVSTRRFYQPAFANSPLSLAAWTKKITGQTTMAVGGVGYDNDFIDSMYDKTVSQVITDKIEQVEQEISQNNFDLIAIGRPLLADPAWFKKVVGQDFNSIKTFSKENLLNPY